MSPGVDRRQVLAYRVVAQGLGRGTRAPAELGVLDLGVQDTNVGSARLALAARLPAGFGDPVKDPSFTLLWSFRGAPHLHRTGDLPGLAAALWPMSDADALARLAAERNPLKAAGIGGREAFAVAAGAMCTVVTRPMTKGEVSAAVTARLPEAYSYRCRSCQATHVYGGLFQLAGLFAGVRLVPDRSPTTLAPLEDRPPVPPTSAGAGGPIRGYLRLHGPATLAEAAGYLGSGQAALRPAWPGDLVEVAVEGRRAWLPEERVDALRDASPASDVVRLLPPSDPYLQARDRDLLVPDRARQKAVWRILGNPGAVLAGGEIAGVWRARGAGKARLEITVQAFGRASAALRAAIGAEAERVAGVRGATDVRVRFEEA
ncbi:MAG: DNA glycosylase AlkZ-like family protein [Streptomycetales bacterium]